MWIVFFNVLLFFSNVVFLVFVFEHNVNVTQYIYYIFAYI